MSTDIQTRAVVLSHHHGLHVRPCLAIVNTLRRIDARVKIQVGSQTADAASILELMALGAGKGTKLMLTATGIDAVEALDALARLMANLDAHCSTGGSSPRNLPAPQLAVGPQQAG